MKKCNLNLKLATRTLTFCFRVFSKELLIMSINVLILHRLYNFRYLNTCYLTYSAIWRNRQNSRSLETALLSECQHIYALEIEKNINFC